MLCLFSLTPPQWAYIFVFPCLHTCTVPRAMHTLPLRLGQVIGGQVPPSDAEFVLSLRPARDVNLSGNVRQKSL